MRVEDDLTDIDLLLLLYDASDVHSFIYIQDVVKYIRTQGSTVEMWLLADFTVMLSSTIAVVSNILVYEFLCDYNISEVFSGSLRMPDGYKSFRRAMSRRRVDQKQQLAVSRDLEMRMNQRKPGGRVGCAIRALFSRCWS